MRLLLIALLALQCATRLVPLEAAAVAKTPLLFIDHSVLKAHDDRLKLEVHRPVKGPRVLKPDKPWESWAIFDYNHVMEVPAELRGDDPILGARFRLYYDCVEGSGVPPGERIRETPVRSEEKPEVGAGVYPSPTSYRRICLAISNDGLRWEKPSLGIFNRKSMEQGGWSKDNNILLQDSGVSVFIDRSRKAVEHGLHWKMITSKAAYQSSDGLYWYELPFAPTAYDDTKPTAYWDSALGKYVIMVRRDIMPQYKRSIGRCVTANLSDWQSEVPAGASGCDVVFQTDDKDLPYNKMDVYTNSWTPYPSDVAPVAHLFFPSIYFHFTDPGVYGNPFKLQGDGVLDIRMLVSRDGVNIDYVQSGDDDVGDRRPFVSLGINECGPDATSPSRHGGWCSPYDGVQSKTSFDTSQLFMASGHLFSPDGNMVYLYQSGAPYTHGDDVFNKTWGSNTGIRVLRIRRDGFVSIDAPYWFGGGSVNSFYPSFLTVEVEVPTLKCAHRREHVSVAVNYKTSAVGFVAVGIEQNGTEVKGFQLDHANRLKGNSIRAKATWGERGRSSLGHLVGQPISFRVSMADASLFSLDFQCA